MRRVWQVAAGDAQHCYLDLFLNHDVVFLGPGQDGPFEEKVYRKRVERGLTSAQAIGQIRSMAKRMKPGDIILLRFGHRVMAVGLAAEEGYEWNDTFDDIFGWDLQHSRRVIWQHQFRKELNRIQSEKELFADRKQIPGVTAVRDPKVLNPIRHLFDKCETRPLCPLPESPPKPLEMEELGQELFSKGLPNERVDKVLVAIRRQRRMARWYEQHGKESGRPTEHEVVAHMILPLMLALGWSEQLLSVEWRNVDLACFWGTPTTPDKCVLVCEAKHLGHGLGNVFEQATRYVTKLELTGTKRILVTDGKRLYLHGRRKDGAWDETPFGYLNMDLIRTRYIAPPNANAVDTIMALTPAGVQRALV